MFQQIKNYHIVLDKKIGDKPYIDTDEDFESFVSKDVPNHFEEENCQQSNIIGEERYDLPDIDIVGKMNDERQAADTYDKYIGVEVSLPGPGIENQMADVVRRIRGDDGKDKGNHNINPILDTSKYMVQFPNDATKRLTANLIAEIMFSNVDQ